MTIDRDQLRALAREAHYWGGVEQELGDALLKTLDQLDAAERRADEAEARIKAVEELCDRASRDAGTLERNLLGGHRLYPKEIRRALESVPPPGQ